MDRRWWLFIHLTGVLGFMLAHGVSAGVALKIRKERDRERIRTLLTFSGSTVVPLYVSIGLLLAGGIGGAIEVGWYKQRWFWIASGVFAFVFVMMLGMARPYYMKVKEAIQTRPSGAPRASDEELAARLDSPVPVIVAVVGFASLAALLWLMIFKPA